LGINPQTPVKIAGDFHHKPTQSVGYGIGDARKVKRAFNMTD